MEPEAETEKQLYGPISDASIQRLLAYWNGETGETSAKSMGFDMFHYFLMMCREVKLLKEEREREQTKNLKRTGGQIQLVFSLVCFINLNFFFI
jgi:hypothetical protein